MKTLPANVTDNYLLTGSRPRLFLNIENAGKSWATTSDLSGYTNRISSGVRISERVDSAGGMSIVSDTSLSVLKLGESIKFYSEATLYPKPEGVRVGAGYIYKSDADYDTARNSTIGTGNLYNYFTVGQTYSTVSGVYSVFRGYIQFDIPAALALTSCEDAYIEFTLAADVSTTDFYFKVYEGNWYSSIGLASFNDFSGWVSSGSYIGTILNEQFYTLSDIENTIRLRLNKAGRDLIVNNAVAGTTVKLMIISENDRTAVAPTTSEFVKFSVISNSTPSLKLMYNTVTPDNQRARIYLGFEDKETGLPTDISSMLNVWSGIVDGWSFTEKELQLNLRHDDFKYNRSLKTNILTTGDDGEFPYLPEDNIGKSKPIVFGDFTTKRSFRDFVGSIIETLWDTRIENTDFFKSYLVKRYKTAVGFNHYLVAEHGMHTVNDIAALWNSKLNSFVILPCDLTGYSDGIYLMEIGAEVFPNTLTSAVISDHHSIPALAPIIVKTIEYNSSTGISDYANSQDNDPTNWSTINHKDDEWNGQNYDSWGVSEMFPVVAIKIEVQADGGFGTNYLNLHWKILKDDGSELKSDDSPIAVNGQTVIYFDHSSIPNTKVNLNITITGDNLGAPGTFNPDNPIKFSNICIIRGFSSDLGIELYMNGKGLADDINGTYTGTSKKLIENPASIIKWLSIEKGTLNSSHIGDTFITAMNQLNSWKFAFQWSDELGINNVFPFGGQDSIIGELARQCKATVFWDNLGKIQMNAFNINNNFPHSDTDYPDDLDIFEFTGTPNTSVFTKHPIFSYKMKKISLDKVYNDFILRYSQNYATGEYNKVLFMTNGNGEIGSVNTNIVEGYLENNQTRLNLMYYTSNSYNVVLTTNTFEFEAWAIRDDATANKLLQYFIEWYTKRRWIIELTSGLNAVCFEIGDFINARFADIEYQFGTATMNTKKWKIININQNLSKGEIKIEAIESEAY